MTLSITSAFSLLSRTSPLAGILTENRGYAVKSYQSKGPEDDAWIARLGEVFESINKGCMSPVILAEATTAAERAAARAAIKQSLLPHDWQWGDHCNIAAKPMGVQVLAAIYGQQYANRVDRYRSVERFDGPILRTYDEMRMPVGTLYEYITADDSGAVSTHKGRVEPLDINIKVLRMYAGTPTECFRTGDKGNLYPRFLYSEQWERGLISVEELYRRLVARCYLAMDRDSKKRVPIKPFVIPSHIEEKINGKGSMASWSEVVTHIKVEITPEGTTTTKTDRRIRKSGNDAKDSISHGFATEYIACILRGQPKKSMPGCMRKVCAMEGRKGDTEHFFGAVEGRYYIVENGEARPISAGQYQEGVTRQSRHPVIVQPVMMGSGGLKPGGNATTFVNPGPQYVRHRISAMSRGELATENPYAYEPGEMWKAMEFAGLTEIESETFSLMLRHLTDTQIAKTMGRTRQAVAASLSAAWEKLRKGMEARRTFKRGKSDIVDTESTDFPRYSQKTVDGSGTGTSWHPSPLSVRPFGRLPECHGSEQMPLEMLRHIWDQEKARRQEVDEIQARIDVLLASGRPLIKLPDTIGKKENADVAILRGETVDERTRKIHMTRFPVEPTDPDIQPWNHAEPLRQKMVEEMFMDEKGNTYPVLALKSC